MARQKGAFFLGMDRMNPQFDRERNLIRRSAKREDLDTIRTYIRSSTEEILAGRRPMAGSTLPTACAAWCWSVSSTIISGCPARRRRS